MEVNIYINTFHNGRQHQGTGTYAATLEYITQADEPATLQLYKGVEGTTKNRTALIACLDAFSRLNTPCLINLYIDNNYVTETINQEWYKAWDMENWTSKKGEVKNADLWKEFFKDFHKHKVNISFQKDTPYSSYMQTMIKKVKIEYKEDNTCLIHSENLTQ